MKTIKEIEDAREGLTDVLVYAINRYEQEFGMDVQRILIDSDTGEILIIDKLGNSFLP